MMRWILIAAMLATGGCTQARMAGFDTLAARGDLDAVDVTGVPGWSSGSFRVDGATGAVHRLAQTDAIGWGPDAAGPAFDTVRVGMAARYGTIEFALTRTDLGGKLEGRCRYGRTEVRDRAFGIDVAAPARPLRLGCAYRIDGREAGSLELTAIAARGPGNAEPRVGIIHLNGTELAIRSSHHIADTPLGTDEPIGYVLTTADGGMAGAIEINGVSRRRMLLPRLPRDRAPALAAMLTLALFQDPADVG